jgi:hypothetical protein
MYQTAVNDGIKAALKGSTPHKGGASNITKEQILSIKDDMKRIKAIEENIDLFRKE